MKINEFEIRHKALDARKILKIENYGPIDIEKIIETQEDFTLVYREMSDNISGLCINGKNKIIVVNTKLSKGRQRFTIAHELCHLLYHDNGCYVCDKNLIDEKVSRYEKEADLFASFFLAPADSFLESYYEFYGRYNNKLDVAVSLQQKFGMSHLAVLTRLKQEKLISSKEYEKYSYEKPLVNALQLGYSKDLYLPTNENKTVGKYIRLTMKLKNNNKISNGKYEELLLKGYREDLVFVGENVGHID